MMVHEHCELVRDLLPLYVDGLVGDESARVIERHLGHCKGCQRQYQAMTIEIKPEPVPPEQVKKPFLKVKKIYVRRTIFVMVMIILVSVFALWGYNARRGEKMITAYTMAYHAFEALQSGKLDIALDYFDASERSLEFILSFRNLVERDIAITRITTNSKRFTISGSSVYGTVSVTIEDHGQTFVIDFAVLWTDGKLSPLRMIGVFGPIANGIGGLLPEVDWPDWLKELDQSLGHRDPYPTFNGNEIARYIVNDLGASTIDNKGTLTFWQLPGLNTETLEHPINEEVVLYITRTTNPLMWSTEKSELLELSQLTQEKGIDLIVIAYGWIDHTVESLGDIGFPVFLATTNYLTREQIKGFPTIRLLSEEQEILWEQVGISLSEEIKASDVLRNYLD